MNHRIRQRQGPRHYLFTGITDKRTHVLLFLHSKEGECSRTNYRHTSRFNGHQLQCCRLHCVQSLCSEAIMGKYSLRFFGISFIDKQQCPLQLLRLSQERYCNLTTLEFYFLHRTTKNNRTTTTTIIPPKQQQQQQQRNKQKTNKHQN